MAAPEPIADRPFMPGYGIETEADGLLPWSWATQRLRDAHGYWVATTDADGAPHLAAVWAVWFDDAVCFATGAPSRKARNLARDPRCSITTGDATESVVVQGRARRITDPAELDRLTSVYIAKYGEGFPAPEVNPVFAVEPITAFGMMEAAFTRSATRWRRPR
jgi:PPOX class probable F420-dependent enzyme